jgi:hypothetical protein
MKKIEEYNKKFFSLLINYEKNLARGLQYERELIVNQVLVDLYWIIL